MKRHIQSLALAICLILNTVQVSASSSSLMDAMLTMLKIFLTLDQYGSFTSTPYSYGMQGWPGAPAGGAYSPLSQSSGWPAMSPNPWSTQSLSPLHQYWGLSTDAPMSWEYSQEAQELSDMMEGMWQSRTGDLFIVRQGLVRHYASRDEYQDYYLRVDYKYLYLKDARTGAVTRYKYSQNDGMLELRNYLGHSVQFRRVQ